MKIKILSTFLMLMTTLNAVGEIEENVSNDLSNLFKSDKVITNQYATYFSTVNLRDRIIGVNPIGVSFVSDFDNTNNTDEIVQTFDQFGESSETETNPDENTTNPEGNVTIEIVTIDGIDYTFFNPYVYPTVAAENKCEDGYDNQSGPTSKKSTCEVDTLNDGWLNTVELEGAILIQGFKPGKGKKPDKYLTDIENLTNLTTIRTEMN